MLEGFLTSALEIIIILDVIGIAAYFILGGLRKRDRRSASPPPLAIEPANTQNAVPLHDATQAFSRVLYGFEKGLNR